MKPSGPKLNIKRGCIDLSHGSGGRATAQLIEQLFFAAFDNQWLAQKNDQACFTVTTGRMVMTTDAHVISPLFFPGGDIGSLAVNGTINDIAMSGAKPLHLSASFILEEGFPLTDLQKIKAPALIMGGDHDVIKPEHTMEIAQNIPRSYLWIFPNSGHSTPVVYADEFNKKADAFFSTLFKDHE